jgi:dephospho-CoA kinase
MVLLKDNSKVKIIELLGVPGSGKSTMVENHVLSSEEDYITREDFTHEIKSKKYFYKLSALLSLTYILWILMMKDIKRISEVVNSRVLKNIYYALLISIFYKKNVNNNSCIIFDQGIFQVIASLYVFNVNEDYIDVIFEHFIGSLTYDFQISIWLVEIDKSLALMRVKKREKNKAWFDDFEETELSSFIGRWEVSIHVLCNKIKNKKIKII